MPVVAREIIKNNDGSVAQVVWLTTRTAARVHYQSMKPETVNEILSQWESVKHDRATRQDCLDHTGPGESPYTNAQDKAWEMREHCLSRTLLAAMDGIATLLEGIGERPS